MKPRNALLFTIIYAIIGILEMIGEILCESGQTVALVYTMKPLLMPVLIGWILANRDLLKDKIRKIFLISLVFSMAGDIFLMFHDEKLFIYGLISFLLAHIMYIIGFAESNKSAAIRLPLGGKLVFALPFVFFVAGFLFILKDHILSNPNTHKMFIPVVIYALVISIMGIFSTWRISGTSKSSFYMVLSGALLFITSDSIIAINKFVQPLPFASLLIMSTYIIAQYLIVRGMLIYSFPAH